jgi:hypothetical protein
MAKKRKRRKPQKDENQMAYEVIKNIAGTEARDAARALGKKGGIARKAKVSPVRLTEIGKQGANARWSKHRKESIALTPENQ